MGEITKILIKKSSWAERIINDSKANSVDIIDKTIKAIEQYGSGYGCDLNYITDV